MGSITKRKNEELPIIQQTYDLIKWYVPLINRLPRDHRHLLGDRLIRALYDTLEDLLRARYSTQKLPLLEAINLRLDIIRYQTRLLRSGIGHLGPGDTWRLREPIFAILGFRLLRDSRV